MNESQVENRFFYKVPEIEMGNDSTQPEESNPPEPRRSMRVQKQPDYYGQESSNVCEVPESPVSYKEATTGPDKKKWESATETEVTSLRENKVWDLVKAEEQLGVNGFIKLKLEQMDLCRDTKHGWLLKGLHNSMEQILMKSSAQ